MPDRGQPLPGTDGTDGTNPEAAGRKPVVVATTTWEGAFAKAAGAEDVTVIVPQSVHHAPDATSVGTYGPEPGAPARRDELSGEKPAFVLDNAHMRPVGGTTQFR
ncbi:hypothetical protein ACHGLA_32410 [Streptomyces sp. YH02]|uniref:hypothetical protein n=1 Tax=Streptomyces sp. YH02 TaxID=3256999 RepID=UPI00375814D0